MNILVTGGSGFVGSQLVRRLIGNHRVRVLDLVKCEVDGVELVVDSVLNQGALSSALANIEVVFHLAGQIDERFSILNPKEDLEINGLGTLNVVQGCKENSVRRIVFASTAAVYGASEGDLVSETHLARPLIPYGCSKLCAETYIKAFSEIYGLEYTILRFFNIYGLNGRGVVSVFHKKASSGDDLHITGDGMQYRDFIYIDDAVGACCDSLSDKAKNQTFNIGSGEQTSIKELAKEIIDITQSTSKVSFLPVKEASPHYPIANINHAKSLIGFSPRYSLRDGLRLMHSIGGK